MADGAMYVDAYKGDGLQGIGAFLAGIGNTYLDIDRKHKELIKHLSPEQAAILDEVTKVAVSRYRSEELSKAAATEDTKAAYAEIFREYREKELPTLYTSMCATGMYDSTTSQLLANDAFSRAVDKANAARHKAIMDYNNAETQRMQAAAAAFNALLNDKTDTSSESSESRTPKMSAFAKDLAPLVIGLGILKEFARRRYFADQQGVKTKDSAGGIVETLFDWVT